jgi:sugar phosphate isomerase/epimerase
VKFGLLTVTYSGLFYDGPALSVEQQIHKAKQLGFDGLAIETKRPVASPIDLSATDRARIKAVAADQGIALCAIESMSNFTSRLMEERENNLAMMRAVLDLANDLDVGLVKVFPAWPGIINDEEATAMYAPYERGSYHKRLYPPDLRKWHHAVNGIREVADWAADMGITLALQNHAPVITPGYEDALSMLQEIERPNVRLCLDVPLFYDRQSDAYVEEAVRRCAAHIAFTHFGAWNFSETEDGEVVQDVAPSSGVRINYEAFVRGLHQIGYDGFLVAEYCLPALERHRLAGMDVIDRATIQALEYMKDVVRRTATASDVTASTGAESTSAASTATVSAVPSTATAASTAGRKYLGI